MLRNFCPFVSMSNLMRTHFYLIVIVLVSRRANSFHQSFRLIDHYLCWTT